MAQMIWVFILLATLAAGWMAAHALTSSVWTGPRWAALLTELGLGALIGPGLASILYFALVAAGLASQTSAIGLAIMLLAAGAAVFFLRRRAASSPPQTTPRFALAWVLWIGVAAGFTFFLLDFQAAATANPAGEWDAMSIWNVRAHDLASGGDLWRRAVSSELGGQLAGAAHPGYPLFLSAFIGLQWTAAGDFDESVPIAASLLFALGGMLLLAGSLASRKSAALGLLAWLILLASEVFASQAAAQYSDLLQGLAFLGALVLLDAARESADAGVLFAAGLAIGLSAWIKNEGLPFALAALVVGVWRFRPRALWLALGTVPGLLATVVLKLFLAQGSEQVFPHTIGEVVDKVAGAGRWWQAALGFAKAVYDAGPVWAHPVLLAALAALALRFVPTEELRKRAWLLIPVAATAAAEYGLYLVTTADLNWHISTSVSRLVAQLWPSLIWLFFLALRAPESALAAPAGSKRNEGGRKRR